MGAGVGRRWKGQRGLEGGMGGGIVNAIGFDGSEVSVKQAADCFFFVERFLESGRKSRRLLYCISRQLAGCRAR